MADILISTPAEIVEENGVLLYFAFNSFAGRGGRNSLVMLTNETVARGAQQFIYFMRICCLSYKCLVRFTKFVMK